MVKFLSPSLSGKGQVIKFSLKQAWRAIVSWLEKQSTSLAGVMQLLLEGTQVLILL